MTAQQVVQGEAAGWQAALQLRFAPLAGCTRLVGRHHRGPLLVQRSFHPEGEVCHVYIVHPPGGVVGGDGLRVEVAVEPGARVLLTSGAATKFYRSGARTARVTQHFSVTDASLEWLPQEGIYYPGAEVRLDSHFDLRGDARMLGWEISCLGLPAAGAAFDSGMVLQCLEFRHDGRLLLCDRIRLDALMHQAPWGLAGHEALGTLLAWPSGAAELAIARAKAAEIAEDTVYAACTCVDGVLLVRALAHRADRIRQLFVDLWAALRPGLMGRPAVAPRIWAT